MWSKSLYAIVLSGFFVSINPMDSELKRSQDYAVNPWIIGPLRLNNDELQQLGSKFAAKHGYFPLHEILKKEIEQAFKACNITEPILVFQNEQSTNSYCTTVNDSSYRQVKVLVLGVGDVRNGKQCYIPLPLIRHSLFHECGHFVADDTNTMKNFKTEILPAFLTMLGFGIYGGIKTAGMLKDYPRIVRILGGTAGGIVSLFAMGRAYHKTIGAYKRRNIERKADQFAIDKLLKKGDCYTLAIQFLDFTANCDEGNVNHRNEYWLFYDHPGYRERARTILEGLRNVGINLNALSLDQVSDDDVDRDTLYKNKTVFQQKFTEQVQKYFPEFLKAQPELLKIKSKL